MNVAEAEADLRREYDRILNAKADTQRKLIREERRVDVLAEVLGYRVHPFHRLLIEAEKNLGNWQLFLAPRGAGKTTMLSKVKNILDGLVDPDIRILIASRVQNQAKTILSEIRNGFEHPRFCELFGDLRGDPWSNEGAMVKGRKRSWGEPTYTVAGADGPIVSKHFNVINCEDLVDEVNSRSQAERDRIHKFFQTSLLPTLILRDEDGRPGRVRVVGTRYNPDDIYGRLIEKEPRLNGSVCVIPALVNPETGEEDTREGVSVVPEILPTEDLRAMRDADPVSFDSQYQQSVRRMSGDMFRVEDFRYVDADPRALIAKLGLHVWAAQDLAGSEKAGDDEYADAVIGIDDARGIQNADVYILEMFRKRIRWQAQLDRVPYLLTWNPIRIGVEGNGFQKERLRTIYQVFGENVGDQCYPIWNLTDKTSRFWKLQAKYEAGRVFHVRAPWNDLLESQMTGYKAGKKKQKDDGIDAVHMAWYLGTQIRVRRRRGQEVGIIGLRNTNRRGRY